MPFVRSVVHPTDFSAASKNAFVHALAIALVRRTTLTILYVGARRPRAEASWTSFPAVRTTLERWGLLEKDSPRSAVFEKLAVRVKKVFVPSRNATAAILNYLDEKPADLLVLATQGRQGLPRWVKLSVAERLARRSKTMTLFVPESANGFVALEDGTISMRHILVPVDDDPSPLPAIEFATRVARNFGNSTVGITLLHVGDVPYRLDLELPLDLAWSWNKKHLQGDVVNGIIGAASNTSANLIAMVTAGHEGVLDALRGSVTERVVRRASCPILTVPTGWWPGRPPTRRKC